MGSQGVFPVCLPGSSCVECTWGGEALIKTRLTRRVVVLCLWHAAVLMRLREPHRRLQRPFYESCLKEVTQSHETLSPCMIARIQYIVSTSVYKIVLGTRIINDTSNYAVHFTLSGTLDTHPRLLR